ncbi:MAG: hypothetical protein DRJ65_20085 [Acidobacteria bacterium]|nr:MAG: hypothetical protein DRJ65_20085 [Acidobacteriota bacterium]
MISGHLLTWFRVLIVVPLFWNTAALVAAASAAGADPPTMETAPATVVSTTPTEATAAQSTATRDADDLSWHSIDGGGGVSASGGLSLVGAIGQPESGLSAGGTQALVGGLWASSKTPLLFSDGFESGDVLQWDISSP